MISILITSSLYAHTHTAPTEHFEDMQANIDDASSTQRAVQTSFLNNLLVKGNAKVQGNIIVEGFIISPQTMPEMCGTVTGPNPATLNAIARYANTAGTQLANSGVLIDNNNNVTGAKNVSDFFNVQSSANLIVGGPFIRTDQTFKKAVQIATLSDSQSVAAAAGTSILIIKHSTPGNPISGNTITFPPSPTSGQLFTIANGDSSNIDGLTLISDASILNPVPNLRSGSSQTVTYIFYGGTWYLMSN